MSQEDDLLDTFHRFRDALFASDTEALDRLLASDYRGYNLRGEFEGREVILEAYRPGAVSLEVFEVRDLQVEVLGEVGIITGVGFISGSFAGEPWEHDLHFLDLYRNGNAGWELLVSHATPMEVGAKEKREDENS